MLGFAALGAFGSLGCGASTEDLFGSVGGAGGAGSQTTGSLSTGSQSTGSQSTGSQSTGSQSTTSAQSTGSTSSTSSGGPLCGDGMVGPGEQCDGANLNGHNCIEQGFANPNGATCSGCQLDFAGCTNVCGNNVLEPGEQCDDGNQNPFDACSAACHPQGTTCAAAIPVSLLVGAIQINADTSGTGTNSSTVCSGASGPELIYAVKPAQTGFLTAWTDPVLTNYDAFVYARAGTSCQAGAELACGDNTPNQPDLVSIPVVQNQVVFLFVDGFNGASGHFALHLDLSAGSCVDPVPILVGSGGIAENAIGTTEGQGSDGLSLTPTCGGNGPDVVYAVTRLAAGSVNVATTATYNSVTYARSTCNDGLTQLTCNNSPTSNDSAIKVDNVGTTTPTYVWIDGAAFQQGSYSVAFGP